MDLDRCWFSHWSLVICPWSLVIGHLLFAKDKGQRTKDKGQKIDNL